jgi:hypothetical protein
VKAVFTWLNANNGAVTALAASIGVLITGIYTIFTIGLWKQAKRQAKITQNMFEASHRPYLFVQTEEPVNTRTHGSLSVKMVLHNNGTVPADITGWELRGTLMDYDGHEQPVEQIEPMRSPVGVSVVPHEKLLLETQFIGGDLPNPVLPFRLYIIVEYKGIAPRTYSTEFEAERAGESWKMRGRRMR